MLSWLSPEGLHRDVWDSTEKGFLLPTHQTLNTASTLSLEPPLGITSVTGCMILPAFNRLLLGDVWES